MKKSYLALGLVAAVAMSSCSNDDPVNVNSNSPAEGELVPVRLSMTTNAADVEVGTRGTGTVGDLKNVADGKIWQHEDIYVLMTTSDVRCLKDDDIEDDGAGNTTGFGFTSANGQGPFLLEQFDGSFWARPNLIDNAVSTVDYTIDKNEWWHNAPVDRFYPLSGGSNFTAYHIDDALHAGGQSVISAEQIGLGRMSSGTHAYPAVYKGTNDGTTDNTDKMYVKFDLDGSQDLMAGYAAVAGQYTDADKGFSARSARAGVTPQITMKHLLSRLTFEVVKGGDNFDRVTLNSITVTSKDKGEMCVASKTIDATPENNVIGNITWEKNGENFSTEAFALKQIVGRYVVDADGKTAGVYEDGVNTYDVYYNLYDGLYYNLPGTENVDFTDEEKITIEAIPEVAVGVDVAGGYIIDAITKELKKYDDNTQFITYDGKNVCYDTDYYYVKDIITKTSVAFDAAGLTTKPVVNAASQSSLETGKPSLVEFEPVVLKELGLAKDAYKRVGEAMFVAPGEESYKMNINMTYLVREASNDAAEAALQALKDAIKTAKATLELRQADLVAAQEAANADPGNATLQDAVVTAQTAVTAAEAALATANTNYEDGKKAQLDAGAALTEDMTQTLTLKFTEATLATVFEAGKSYNVKVVIYGYQPAEIKVELDDWVDGGEFEVGGDAGDEYTEPVVTP